MTRHEALLWADARHAEHQTTATEAGEVLARLEPDDYRATAARTIQARALRDVAGFAFVLRALADAEPDQAAPNMPPSGVTTADAVQTLVAATSGRATRAQARDALALAGVPAGYPIAAPAYVAAALVHLRQVLTLEPFGDA